MYTVVRFSWGLVGWCFVLMQPQKSKLAVGSFPRIWWGHGRQKKWEETQAADILHSFICRGLSWLSILDSCVGGEGREQGWLSSMNANTCEAKAGEICRGFVAAVLAVGFFSVETC